MIKTRENVKAMINAIGMSEIFKIEVVDGTKRINRWGFFAHQSDGTYAVYRPATPVMSFDTMFEMYDDDPGVHIYIEQIYKTSKVKF
jgi:hypothetical protein